MEEAQAPEVKRPAKRARKPAFKVSRFDKDAARLIQTGVASLDAICSRLGVGKPAAKARLDHLAVKGLLSCDAPDIYGLTVAGYNKFALKLKLPAQPNVQQTKDLLEVFATPPKPFRAEPTPTVQTTKPAQQTPGQQVDLGEMLRKGAPQSNPPKEKEVCELCRAEFRLSVKNPSSAKFAHCVCGAAYHKDCYQALLQNGGCARCGRKLSALLDKSSEEAVKGIKDAFE